MTGAAPVVAKGAEGIGVIGVIGADGCCGGGSGCCISKPTDGRPAPPGNRGVRSGGVAIAFGSPVHPGSELTPSPIFWSNSKRGTSE